MERFAVIEIEKGKNYFELEVHNVSEFHKKKRNFDLKKIQKGLLNWNIVSTNRKRKSSVYISNEGSHNPNTLGEIESIEIYQGKFYEGNKIIGKIILETTKGYSIIIDRKLGEKFIDIDWTDQGEIVREGIEEDEYEKVETITAIINGGSS